MNLANPEKQLLFTNFCNCFLGGAVWGFFFGLGRMLVNNSPVTFVHLPTESSSRTIKNANLLGIKKKNYM